MALMDISTSGLEMIKSFEGLRLKAYKAVSTEKYYTIGYGHYDSDITKDMTITKAQAEQLLKQDLENAIRNVNTYNSKYNFNQNQFDALVSFAFNIGSIHQLTALGTRSKATIGNKMLQYTKSGGKVVKGLVIRRQKEHDLYVTPVNTLDYEEIAKEVIGGKWGNGAQRKQALTKAGYDYTLVQQVVNKMLKG